MSTLTETSPGVLGNAVMSSNGLYRYRLSRVFPNHGEKAMTMLMLNPSTADANKDDPTVRRCISFAQRENCGRLIVVNVFGLRSTDPDNLTCYADPVGRENDINIHEALQDADIRIAAFGAWFDREGLMRKRLAHMAQEFGGYSFQCLGKTRTGRPCHPLYLGADTPLVPWSFADVMP